MQDVAWERGSLQRLLIKASCFQDAWVGRWSEWEGFMQPAAMEAFEKESLDRVGASHHVQGREQLSADGRWQMADGRQMACWTRVWYGMVWYGMV